MQECNSPAGFWLTGCIPERDSGSAYDFIKFSRREPDLHLPLASLRPNTCRFSRSPRRGKKTDAPGGTAPDRYGPSQPTGFSQDPSSRGPSSGLSLVSSLNSDKQANRKIAGNTVHGQKAEAHEQSSQASPAQQITVRVTQAGNWKTNNPRLCGSTCRRYDD